MLVQFFFKIGMKFNHLMSNTVRAYRYGSIGSTSGP